MAKKIVLAGACRTAIGVMGGTLSTTPATDLGAIVIKEALNRAGVPADQVDQVYMGCVIQASIKDRDRTLLVRHPSRLVCRSRLLQLRLTLYVVPV